MAPKKKNPTNADIYRKLDSMDVRIGALENWKIAEDAARKAIIEYKKDETAEAHNRIFYREARGKAEIIRQVGIILGLIATILYVFLATKGHL